MTGAIESDAGVYVAKLTSLLDREATDQKKASIIEERKQEQYDSLLKKWRKETDIKVDKKVWKKVDFEETGKTWGDVNDYHMILDTSELGVENCANILMQYFEKLEYI